MYMYMFMHDSPFAEGALHAMLIDPAMKIIIIIVIPAIEIINVPWEFHTSQIVWEHMYIQCKHL